jgi:hypothetical protein
VARLVAGDLRSALGLRVDVLVVHEATMPAGLRALIEKKLPLEWDVLLFA